VQLKPGDTVSFQTPGGGGYGPAEQRDPAKVLKDVRDGKVSLERARDIYRVEIDTDNWRVNEAATKQLRAAGSASIGEANSGRASNKSNSRKRVSPGAGIAGMRSRPVRSRP
jgi:hypothetical protein